VLVDHNLDMKQPGKQQGKKDTGLVPGQKGIQSFFAAPHKQQQQQRQQQQQQQQEEHKDSPVKTQDEEDSPGHIKSVSGLALVLG